MARVLLLEDEPSIARIIELKLEREGHLVLRRPAGPVPARDQAAEFEPDLVLLDLGPGVTTFPPLDGLNRPLVVLIDGADAEAAERARQAGALEVVPKPFKPTVLARLVRSLTEQGRVTEGP
jgi:two-component system OmpR family response regulator